MGLRETVNRNQKTALGLVVVVVAVCGGLATYLHYLDSRDPMEGSGTAFYTTDDGKSFFVADSNHIPPFMNQGKEAVQALVYTADGGKTKFVGYLMRFTPQGAAKLKAMRDASRADSAKRSIPSLDAELQNNTEVKKPGASGWVKLSNIAAAAEVMSVRVPGDATRLADPVDP